VIAEEEEDIFFYEGQATETEVVDWYFMDAKGSEYGKAYRKGCSHHGRQ
jgi:hypothetical protein